MAINTEKYHSRPVHGAWRIYIFGRLSRLIGNLTKIIAYPFHALFPKKRFVIPEFSLEDLEKSVVYENWGNIPKIIWQTNYSNRVTLPVYCNYLINRFLSRDGQYRYISTENRALMIQRYGNQAQYQAYMRLNNGAAQADFWRIFTLNLFGGVYLDIDAQLVCAPRHIINEEDQEVLLWRNEEISNYFMAITAQHPLLIKTLQKIQDNIDTNRSDKGVFAMTGPGVLREAVQELPTKFNARLARFTALQGTFTNEHFQYLDKKGSKWTHAKAEDLLK